VQIDPKQLSLEARRIDMKKRWMIGASLAMVVALGAPLVAAADWNTNEDNVVLGGFDVVAYFHQDRAVEGTAKLKAEYDGGTFYFSSQENLDAFRGDPAKFAPKFGGFCAFGVAAQKAKAPVNPQTFKIYNGELLLFFDDVYQGKAVNTKILWNGDERHFYEQASKTWPTLD